MNKFLQELGFNQEKHVLYCDNQSAIHLAKHPAFHALTKPVDMRYYWIRDIFEAKLSYLDKTHKDKLFRYDD